jgi:LmbE family N-acetylglucosaminyl deacetylase/regulation of enolase protein 1 (concanavalin A-like superfamily)
LDARNIARLGLSLLTGTILAVGWSNSAAASPTAIEADNFNGTALNSSIWSFANPVGDASVSVSDGHANIAVPAGATHDVWGNNNSSTGLRQVVPNADFEVEAKFDSVVSTGYQMQGIIVEQDSNDLLRAEVHHDGAGTRLFVASTADGSSSVQHYATVPSGGPFYMRVVRTGNQWQVRYSQDGSTWTNTPTFNFALTVNRMGPMGGNSGNPSPAFTAQVDYFKQILPDSTAPVISGVSAAGRTLDATVTWTTDEPSSSEVRYGTTTSYGAAKVASGGLSESHSVVVHGLACGTTYHYQVRSKDAGNNEAVSGDFTFTTLACPGLPQNDEFNGATIDLNRWTLVDPVGDATLSATGTQAQIALPAGSQHDIWTGSDTVTRLLQPAPDDNFDMTVKYDSVVGTAYQMQGLVVQQDADDLLHVEVHYDGADTKLFAASVAGGTASMVGDIRTLPDGAPVYLRLRRSGSTWTLSYSSTGSVWTHSTSFSRAMTVRAAGLLAGNSGVFAPAFQARADWFHYTPPDRTAPVINDASVTAAPGAGSSATVSWTTDEPASSEVSFGKTSSYDDGTIAGPAEVASHATVLHGLKCNTVYNYRVRSVDPSGNASTGANKTFTSAPCPAVLQSDEFSASTLDTSTWVFIDPLGDSTASFATGQAQLAVPAGQAHDLWSTVRTAPRLLQSTRDEGFEVVAKFDTAVGATTQQQGIVVEETHQKLLRFETYFESGSTHLFVAAINGASAEIIHDSVVPGGVPSYLKLRRVGTSWTFSYSTDGEGWRSTAFERSLAVAAVGPYIGNGGNNPPAFQGKIDYFREITDRVPPVLTQIVARPVSRQAQVTWTTDESADSTVEFRAGTSGAWSSATRAKLETRHSVVAAGLGCATSYQFRAKSKDALGNTATSGISTFTTAPCTSTGGPDIDVWNGATQTFGEVGIPQTWVNVTGNVSDPDGVQSITGALNENGREQLGFTPDGWRVQRPGDFNYEINTSELLPGPNTVELRATDAGGRVTTTKVTLNWQGQGAGTPPSATGPVLVVAAHPDDESLGAAGIIDRAKAAGRRVYVAIVTNGEGSAVETQANYCNAPSDAARAAGYGLLRDREARDAMSVLGLTWSANLQQTELIFMGYPGGRLPDVATTDTPINNSMTGIQRTYAEEFDGNTASCNGDYRYLLSGQHSQFTRTALRNDLDALLAQTSPSDIYTHTSIDGHLDHAEISRQVRAAVRRADRYVRIHETMQHPQGDTFCMDLSSRRWPNPALTNNNPFARFTPTLDFTTPPANPCNAADASTSWGPLGAPGEWVDVPASMQSTTESANKKWQAISKHASQIDCSTPSDYHVNCGYMRAFVKKREFFWRYDFGKRRMWPKTYTTNFTSNDSIARQAQVLDGVWRFENGGVRPLVTGFDRALLIGDTGWTDYEVTAPFRIHSFDPQTPQGAAVGLAVGWQGHNAWGQPRVGHPGGGLCLYARGGSEPMPFQLQIGYSPGPVDDTTLATKAATLAPNVQYRMRFRQRGISAGLTRYSCKVWRADQNEPAAWDLETDIPDWAGTTGQRSGSAVLLAHETDVTFGNATIAPAGP